MSAFLVATLVTALTDSRQATGTASTNPVLLPVVVFDYASVPAQWLSWARDAMSRIYRDIGVEIAWREPQADARTGVIILIVPETPTIQKGVPDAVIGYSSGAADDRRRVAYVLYGRLDRFRLEQVPQINRGNMLGALMAHEVGHLLLPVDSHSSSGLMRARWNRGELELAQHGRLRFTADQARLIRAKLSRLAEAGREGQVAK